jgi:TolB-like protein
MEEHAGADIVLFGGFRFDRRRGLLSRQNEDGRLVPVAIGSRALDVLGLLIDRHGDLVSREEIMNAVWPGVVEGANVTVQISALRRALDDGRSDGSPIQTIPGRGYRFTAAVTRRDRVDPDRASRLQARKESTENIARALKPELTEEPARTSVPPAAAPRLSIVVLPFTNLSDDREQQYFADAITEDLTTDLSRLANMFVISRNTAFTYRNKPVDTKQIGRELGVRYVLEGSVRRSGNQLRVNAQLIDAATDAHLWTERFDRDTADLFALQDEITSRIAIALNLELVTVEAARPTSHPDAFDYILRARAAYLKPPSRDRYAAAIPLYERALALDPRSVEAQSELANILMARVVGMMSDSPAADITRAEGLVGQALAASPRSPLAHKARGQLLRAQNRFQEAIPEYETALAFNRNWVAALGDLGNCKLFTGSLEEVIPLMEQAIRLSPRDPQIGLYYYQIGRVHLLQSRIEEAIHWLEKARSAMPEPVYIHASLASAYGLKGDTERAATELAEARALCADHRHSSIARLKAAGYFGLPEVRALYEATYFVGLRKAGVPEE